MIMVNVNNWTINKNYDENIKRVNLTIIWTASFNASSYNWSLWRLTLRYMHHWTQPT